MLSTVIGDQVLDWHFKKRKVDTLLYIGDTLVGQVFEMKRGWTAISQFDAEIILVNGFRTRYDAGVYLEVIFRIRRLENKSNTSKKI